MKAKLPVVNSTGARQIGGRVAVVIAMMIGWKSACGANVMNYGADGNDYFQFTTPSLACDQASGFTTLITFAMHVDANGTLEIGGGPVCSNGVYIGPSNWNALITTLKTPPTTVTRYEVCIGGWQDTSYDNLKSLIALQGTGTASILHRNFQALKNAVSGIDAINDDDEKTYDLSSSVSFANMLGGLGYKFTMAPYTQQSFWVNLNNAVTNCDYIYLQCYEGGGGNDPGQWNTAFGHGVKVIPGQESNTASPATWLGWYQETETQGGFYYPDVVFNTAYWSALVYQTNGAVPAAPTGVTAVAGFGQVSLSWNTIPGAVSYNIRRGTTSGGEITVANVSTVNNAWPNSNQYIDTGLAGSAAYYYQITGVNTDGEGIGSVELSAAPQAASVFNFESPYIGIGTYQYNLSGGPWTYSGTTGNGSGIVSDGSAFGNPNAPGTNMQAGFIQEYGSISRAIPGFEPGTNYTISFSAAERDGNNQTWNAKINNSVIGSYNPGSSATGYTDYTANFTATASTQTLQFVGTDLVGGDNTVFIGNVRINPPLLPVPTVAVNTTPSTATDVVGGQVAFTASFGGQQPMAYQWEVIKAGVTNIISSATNATLVLTNLQLSDSGSYLLQASNAYGVALSTSAPLTVSNLPAPVNNVITAMSAQTGLGGGIFTPTWSLSPGSLIARQAPSVTNGNFSLEVAGRSVIALTSTINGLSTSVINGTSGTTCSTNYVTCGNGIGAGATVIYTLTGNTNGYNVTNITVFGGWADAGRDQQAYTVSYSKVSNPTNFISLAVVNYNPVNTASVQSATRASLRPAVGPVATNVAAVKFDFTTPNSENGYCGYAQIQVFGAPVTPTIVADTLPATALDVVGSQVTFQAAFSGLAPLSCQWLKISGGVTNNVPGATNTTLMLTNLQLVDAASYCLSAANNNGSATSTPRPLTVNSAPAPVNNIVTAYAAQTGLGGSSNNFYTTWTVAQGSLIAGMSPSSTGSGDFSDPYANECGTVTALTDGSIGFFQNIPGNGGSPTQVACGPNAGQFVAYTLPAPAYGYNLTNITVYGGWGDAGRDQQAYTIYYSTVSSPHTFVPLSTVNFNPSNPLVVQSATRATLTPVSGYLATNVAAVKFDFTTPSPENGYCGYSEIQVFGVPNLPPAMPVMVGAAISLPDSIIMNINDMVMGRTYEIQSTTNLVSPVWVTETNFVAGTASASLTNSISTDGQKFYRVVGF